MTVEDVMEEVPYRITAFATSMWQSVVPNVIKNTRTERITPGSD